MRVGLALLLLLVATLAHATVYKWVDEEGKVHFSDEPVKNAEVVELKENTQNNIKLPEVTVIPSYLKAPEAAQPSYKMSIASPSEQESIRSNDGNITIITNITPKIADAHQFALYMDGNQIGNKQTIGIFKLSNIDRGEHRFVVKVLDQNGKRIASTPVRTIFLHRTSINAPTRIKPQPRVNE
ncbi:conserved hypothetical protein [Shewanella halifaxensis HAW-EB4]|uniref:DUF4124 domain-containing protein n=1 Tax=Shewanella halifaxensis (strain HAW-EB4) TaxID=458817 RepID=B0TPP8_SHEHH|nr:DUF4124 domain-containing protein [Shewanella halifaxensis]ABZ74919.1 conserved hypothetical protein [Shewanella halifaxensis HAW-EB4]